MTHAWDPTKYGLQKHRERTAHQQPPSSDLSYISPIQDPGLVQQPGLNNQAAVTQQPSPEESTTELAGPARTIEDQIPVQHDPSASCPAGATRPKSNSDESKTLKSKEQTTAETPNTINSSFQRPAGDPCTKKALSLTSAHLVMTGSPPGVDGVQEQLLAARQGALREISARVNRGGKYDTASLRDLALARSPVDKTRPHKSRRPWAAVTHIVNFNDGRPVEQKPVPVSPPAALNARKSKWATKEEMKYVKPPVGSNDWGSVSSEAAAPSDTTDAMFGKLLRQPANEQPDDTLYNWDGSWIPPNCEWHNRPSFHNNTRAFKQNFKNWCSSVSPLQGEFSNGNTLTNIKRQQLLNPDLVPDGISYVSKSTTVNIGLARHYGYAKVDDIIDLAHPDPPSEPDDPTYSKVDMSDALNCEYAADTTEMYVQNWLAHAENCRKSEQGSHPEPRPKPGAEQKAPASAVALRLKETSEEGEEAHVPGVGADDGEDRIVPKGWTPKLNIFLRPARDEDVTELMRIYNWYIRNSPRASETTNISQQSMEYRLRSSKDSGLPFFVAVMKSRKDTAISRSPTNQVHVSNQRENYRRRNRAEKLVGFCCVQDFTCADYVEHISAEVEVYVDDRYLHQGVGRCLLDKALEICDYGYSPHGGYLFICTEEERHLHIPRGGRDVHKLWFVMRNYHQPRASKLKPSNQKALKNTAFVKTDENIDLWLRPWLETYGFEVEGHLRRNAAKQGRYIDTIYLGRETSWKPDEGTVPDPPPLR